MVSFAGPWSAPSGKLQTRSCSLQDNTEVEQLNWTREGQIVEWNQCNIRWKLRRLGRT